MKVLIIEDEAKIGDYLRRGLSERGWVADVARDGRAGLHQAQTGLYDAIVLDVMLPGLDGFAVLAELRRSHQTPVLMLTARDQLDDRLRGLTGGADDYLVKPFSFLELVARLDNISRRAAAQVQPVLTIADLKIDLLGRRATRGARPLRLTAKEFALLEELARRPSQIVSKTVIAERVWDINFDTGTNVVEVAIRRLRAKLEAPGEAKLIHTVRGMGYVIEHRPGESE
ncbi:MAG: two-component system copper resistance phosphate regulon response regulator CusR [Brevundimonas sp.]|jgi:two-component system copper resistance phosphate regulon response regulator CusR|uniref:heavy metal response regulator transcription factor n=1 Tax=Brevundimonas sp. TaxID=1871086 RepID=UPI0039E4F9A9